MTSKDEDDSDTHYLSIGCGQMHVILAPPEKPKRITIKMEREGSCLSTLWHIISELVNLCLEFKVPLNEIKKIFEGNLCSKSTTKRWPSCGNAFASILPIKKEEK